MDNNSHNIRLENRKKLVLDGVSEVISFDDVSVCLDTAGGRLNIGGEGLHVQTLCLESGSVTVEGRIDEIVYEEEIRGKRRGFFGRAAK